MEIPSNLRYSDEHLWIKVEGDLVLCGITDHAQELLGEISFVELPEVGTTIRKDEKLLTIESLKSVFDVMSPASFTITDVNKALNSSPTLINSSPYGEGWLLRCECKDRSELDGLMSAEEYRNFIAGSA
jgi:glycine cleavage system H protein